MVQDLIMKSYTIWFKLNLVVCLGFTGKTPMTLQLIFSPPDNCDWLSTGLPCGEWGNIMWHSVRVGLIMASYLNYFNALCFFKLRFVTSHHRRLMLYSQGLQQGSKDHEAHRQSNDFDSPRSSTYLGQPQKSAYWSPKLNDIVVSAAHC